MRRRVCRQFDKAHHRLLDGIATSKDMKFLDEHAEQCVECALVRETMADALHSLEASVISSEGSDGFEHRVIRRYRVESSTRSLAFWSPALIGAAVAAVALLAVLQMLISGPDLKPIDIRGQEASRQTTPPLPAYSESASMPSRR